MSPFSFGMEIQLSRTFHFLLISHKILRLRLKGTGPKANVTYYIV
jgi:hypothetical protein